MSLKLKSILKEGKSLEAEDLTKAKQTLLNRIADILKQNGYDEIRETSVGHVVVFATGKTKLTIEELRSLAKLSIRHIEIENQYIDVGF